MVVKKINKEWLNVLDENGQEKHLWEILLPDNQSIKKHKKWDRHVRSLTKGMTILSNSIGEWWKEERPIREKIVPVRLLTTHTTMFKIADFSKIHYEQEEIMFYIISHDIYFI